MNTPSTFDILSSLVVLFQSLTLAVAPLVPPVITSLNWKLPTASFDPQILRVKIEKIQSLVKNVAQIFTFNFE